MEEEVREEEEVAVPVLEEVLADILAQEEGPGRGKKRLPKRPYSLVEELEILTIEEAEEDEEEEAPFEEMGDEIWEIPQLTPDAGKIRFAEDILEFERGGGGRRAGARGWST